MLPRVALAIPDSVYGASPPGCSIRRVDAVFARVHCSILHRERHASLFVLLQFILQLSKLTVSFTIV